MHFTKSYSLHDLLNDQNTTRLETKQSGEQACRQMYRSGHKALISLYCMIMPNRGYSTWKQHLKKKKVKYLAYLT